MKIYVALVSSLGAYTNSIFARIFFKCCYCFNIISVGVLAMNCYNCLHNTNTPFVDCYQNFSAVPTVACVQGWCQVKQFDLNLEQQMFSDL